MAARAGSLLHAIDILTGRRTGNKEAALQLINDMDPNEFRLRNRIEQRQYTRMKARPRPFARRPSKRWTMG